MSETSLVILRILLPITLVIFMIGVGLSLKVRDFLYLFQVPRAVAVGLFGQLVCLPLVAFTIAKLTNLSPVYAVGLMLLALSPGGPSSNFFTFVIRGNVALSVTLTSLSSVISVISIPFLAQWALLHFLGAEKNLVLPAGKTFLQLFVLILLPMSVGMWVRSRKETLATKIEPWARKSSLGFLVIVVFILVSKEWRTFLGHFDSVGPAVVGLLVGTMCVGAMLARLARVDSSSRKAIVVEVGMQNAMAAMNIAISPFLLNNTQMGMPAAIYGILMYFACFSYIAIARGKK